MFDFMPTPWAFFTDVILIFSLCFSLVRGSLSMVRDEKAESLEKACLYHGAALRWLIVLNQCTNQSERIWVSRRRSLCLEKAKRRRDKWILIRDRFYRRNTNS
ncbi:PerC family transcriptional regulator [Salmonella enterica subsp. enterica]|nr:PerC family transcriptional regulator [Salmonella enterica subsp. enterica serovar Papuana]ECR2652695.1 PerC family transcriptional regulator [Salmonella enterica subsp. enterica]